MNIKRVKQDWDSMSGESVDVEEIGGVVYGFGSELATLRLLSKYRDSKNFRQGYSENRQQFYVSLEPRFAA